MGFVVTEQTKPCHQRNPVLWSWSCLSHSLVIVPFQEQLKAPGRLCLTVSFSCSIKLMNKEKSSMSNKIRFCCLCPLEALSLWNSPLVTSVISISPLGLHLTKLVPGGNFYEDVNKTSWMMVALLLLWCLHTLNKEHSERDSVKFC